MKPDWILIANAARARLLQHDRGSPMVVVQSFAHQESRERVGTLADDKMGQERTDTGFGGAAYQPRLDAKDKEHLRFAHELALYLQDHAQRQSFHALTIYASSPFLGKLKAELHPATQQRLAATHDLDLTGLPLEELEQRLAASP